MEAKGFRRPIAEKNPFDANAAPIIEDFLRANQTRISGATRQQFVFGSIQVSGQELLAGGFDDAFSARPEVRQHVSQNLLVFRLIIEISEGGVEVEHEIERAGPHEI